MDAKLIRRWAEKTLAEVQAVETERETRKVSRRTELMARKTPKVSKLNRQEADMRASGWLRGAVIRAA